MNTGMLHGIKVLDMSQIIAGPTVAMYLGDYGADVIKVEPLKGDAARSLEASALPPGFGREFLAGNRNKRSIALDFSSEGGRGIVRRLVKQSDVLVTNLVEAPAERLGLDYESVRTVNPRMIYARVTAFGGQGALANLTGMDLAFQARAGVVGARRMPDGTPVVPTVFISDYPAAMMLSFGVAMALFERERSGLGQRVEVSLIGMALHMQKHEQLRIRGNNLPVTPPQAASYPYQCADGEWIMTVVLTNEQWQRLCGAINRGDLLSDDRFTSFKARSDNFEALHPILKSVFKTRSRDEWLERLQAVGVVASPILHHEEVMDDPLVRASGALVDMDYEEIGKVSMVGLPVNFSRTAGSVTRPAPKLGEHTRELLAELGYSPDEIGELLRNGAVAEPAAPATRQPDPDTGSPAS